MRYLTLLIPVFISSALQAQTLSSIDLDAFLASLNRIRAHGCQCGDRWMPAVPPISIHPQLMSASRKQAIYLSQINVLTHAGPGGTTSSDRIEREGYDAQATGENAAYNYATWRDVMEGWLESPGHCMNLMDPDYREFGISKAGRYWVMDFGKRW